MSTKDEWAQGYARQANADFVTWSRLQDDLLIPECHRLLLLQMACEKLVKGHLAKAGANPKDLQTSHAYTQKNLPIIIRGQIDHTRFPPKNAAWVVVHAKHLSQEIELLNPAVKRGGQCPDNCEYPWEDESGRLHVPIDWTFMPSKLLTAAAGRTFLKLIHEAIKRLL